MPNIKSAEKRVHIAVKRTLRNASLKSSLRTTLKKFETAMATNDVQSAGVALKIATRAVDKAATKGIIHRNQANRRKSRMTRRYNHLQAAK